MECKYEFKKEVVYNFKKILLAYFLKDAGSFQSVVVLSILQEQEFI